MYKQMKKHKMKAIYRNMLQDKKHESKIFKTATGSPILYTKFKKHKGTYYPLKKHHVTKRPKPQQSHLHAAVVYSRSYGREVLENVDIWPDNDKAKDRLLQKNKRLSLSEEDDFGIDIREEIVKLHDGLYHQR
jgi:hypothetical protein